jgi:hypothetical protein
MNRDRERGKREKFFHQRRRSSVGSARRNDDCDVTFNTIDCANPSADLRTEGVALCFACVPKPHPMHNTRTTDPSRHCHPPNECFRTRIYLANARHDWSEEISRGRNERHLLPAINLTALFSPLLL